MGSISLFSKCSIQFIRTVVELRKMAANGSGVPLVTTSATAATPSPAPVTMPTVTTTLIAEPSSRDIEKPRTASNYDLGGSRRNHRQSPADYLALDGDPASLEPVPQREQEEAEQVNCLL